VGKGFATAKVIAEIRVESFEATCYPVAPERRSDESVD